MAIALNKGWTPGQEWKGFDWQNPGGAATDPATPLPQSGNGAFGLVPGSVPLPNPATDLGNKLPGLTALNQGASDFVGDEINGTFPQSDLDALQNSNASWAVQNGMPNSPFSNNRLLGNIFRASEDRRRRGLEDLNRLTQATSNTQVLPPGIKAQIQRENADNAAAPNPRVRANYSESHAADLFNKYLENIRGPGGGTGGYGGGPASGTGSYVPHGTSNPFSAPIPDVYDPSLPSSYSTSAWDPVTDEISGETSGSFGGDDDPFAQAFFDAGLGA